MIVGAACMAHSAVEGGQARLIVRPERRGSIFFLHYLQFFLQSFFSGGRITKYFGIDEKAMTRKQAEAHPTECPPIASVG